MAQIATQLGVSQQTISNDLTDLPIIGKSKSSKTASNPKGAGRPKGSGRKERIKNTAETLARAASLCLDQGMTRQEAMTQTGIAENQVQLGVEHERGRREMLAELLDAAAAKNFTEKGALKIEDAIRIHKARLDKQFEQRVNEEVRRRIDAADNAAREHNKRLLQENINLQRMVGHRGVFTKSEFRKMQMLCHPDNSASPQLRAELSQILVENEKKIVKFEK